jgi:hypothetical protein
VETKVYQARSVRGSSLWQCLWNKFEDFLVNHTQRHEKSHGFLRPIINEVVDKFLECGDLSKGFARIRCDDCAHEMLLSFSCKCRWFCPSCHQKKVQIFGEFVCEEVAFAVPHRQYVFTIPKVLRVYFRNDRRLLSDLCLAARDSLRLFFVEHLGLPKGKIGAVLAIHTFGDYLNFHPHVHMLVSNGLFIPSGLFYCMPPVDLQTLEELFREHVLGFLVAKGKLDPVFAQKLRAWRHSGFGVHNGKVIAKDDRAGLERVAQYIARNSFSESKMTYNEATGVVLYRSKSNYNTKRNFEVFTAEDFIAAITEHIPDKYFQNIRYYGWYSNKSRGLRAKQGREEQETPAQGSDELDVIDVSDYKPPKRPTKHWRELIKKVWNVDPLICPKCGEEMKVIALIDEPSVVKRILDHLGLWQIVCAAVRPRSPPITDREAHLFPGEHDQYALALESPCSDGIDELPQEYLPTIVYD